MVDLLDDESPSSVRFHLPVTIGARYGASPGGLSGQKVSGNRVDISADIYMAGTIKSITSPTHKTIDITSGGTGSPTKSRVKYESSSYLSQDFVLVVVAQDLDKPRCFAQQNVKGATAIQLTIVPNFPQLTPINPQEYIFLIDRSGSMDGKRIETAKSALASLLRSLPSSGTTFNIFSFGSKCDSLWGRSQRYNQNSLPEAVRDLCFTRGC